MRPELRLKSPTTMSDSSPRGRRHAWAMRYPSTRALASARTSGPVMQPTRAQPWSNRCCTAAADDSRFSTSTDTTSVRVGCVPISTVGSDESSSDSAHEPPATELISTPSSRPSRRMWCTVAPGASTARCSIRPRSLAEVARPDRMRHRRAVRVDPEVGGRDDQPHHRRQAGRQVLRRTAGTEAEVLGDAVHTLTHIGANPGPVVEGARRRGPRDAAHAGDVVERDTVAGDAVGGRPRRAGTVGVYLLIHAISPGTARPADSGSGRASNWNRFQAIRRSGSGPGAGQMTTW